MSLTPFELAPGVELGAGELPVIAGPCVIESPEETLALAARISDMGRRLGVPVVFKASFDKANRSSLESFRGPGFEAGLAVLEAVRDALSVPVLTDVHEDTPLDEVADGEDDLRLRHESPPSGTRSGRRSARRACR